MSKTKGVVVYEILPDGCLNGVYANDRQASIFNEIARKDNKDKEEFSEDLSGNYTCVYIDVNNTVNECLLKISGSGKQFALEWYKGKKLKFNGIGWKTRDNQLTVRYEEC